MGDDARLSDILLRWEEGRDRGTPLGVDELCRDCPELRDEVRRRIAALESIDGQLASSTSLPTRPSVPAGGSTAAASPRIVGRYRLDALLGRGSFGEVWRAFDPLLQRPVAVKMPRSDREWPRAVVDQFLAEARKLARLEHPGIVPVYDVHQEADTCFIVSRLIDGYDLAQWTARQRPTPPEAARLVGAVAEALHFAHLRNLVHRDVKPGNILVDGHGRPYLTDFGLAVTEEEQLHEEAGLRGTLAYMPPEQARGDSNRVDGRADIYALGGVLYELLTGRRPFVAAAWHQLREQILTREPRPPRSINESVPRELERICLKCLAKPISERYATGADLAEELRRWLPPSTAAPLPPTTDDKPLPPVSAEEPPTIHPLDFTAELARLGEGFIGREWLDAELERWLAQTDSRMFLVTGDPGAGKSAYLAHVVGKYPQVVAYHFCVASLDESLDPLRFIESIAAQIAARNADYRRAVAECRVGSIAEADAGALLRRLLADPLRQLTQPGGRVVVIDALDEAITRSGDNIARLIRDRIDDLPGWLRFVVSARKEPEVLDLFSRVRTFEIEVSRPENLQDVAGYITRRFAEPALTDRLQRAGVNPDITAQLIACKGAGNFLYVTQALEAIQSGQIDPARPETFPEGLVGIYQSFFDRVFPRRRDYDPFRPLLDVMCAAREPLTAEQIGELLDRDPFAVGHDLERVAVLFPERDGRYRACHKSLTDWLCGLAGRSKTFRVNVAAGQKRLAEQLHIAWRAGQRERFVLAHLPTHLVETGRWSDLEEVLTDLAFIEAKCAAGLTFALVTDYNAALAAWSGHSRYDPFGPPPAPPPVWLRECTTAALNSHDDPHPRQGAGPVRDLLAAVPDDQRERSATPGTSPAALAGSPRTEAVRAQMERAEESSRAGRDPHRADTPTGRVESFAAFVSTHSHFLQQHPHQLVPLARNHASGGVVADKAIPLAEARTLPWVARDPRPAALLTRPACLRMLRGHTDMVLGIALSGDGQLAVSASGDRTVRIWDNPSGECLGVLTGHSSPINGVALTPDGQLAVSAGNDAALRVWLIAERQCLREMRGHIGMVFGVALTADGSLAVSGGRDRSVRVWDVAGGRCLRILEGHAGSVRCVDVTPDGKLAASGDDRGVLRLWDPGSGRCLRVLRGHNRGIWRVALSADGRTLISAGAGKTLRVWDTATGAGRHVLSGHASGLVAALTPDGCLAASSGGDGTLRVWHTPSAKCLRLLHTTSVSDVAVTRDGTLAATSGFDQIVRIWDLSSGLAEVVHPGHQSNVFHYAWSSDGTKAASASRDHTLRVWDMETGRCLRVLRGHKTWVHGVAWAADGATLISSGWDAHVRVWDLKGGGRCCAVLKGHTGEVRDVALTGDGRRIASASYDQTIRVWELAAGECVQVLRGHTTEALTVAWTLDGRRVLSGGWGGSVRVWDIESGRCLRVLHGHTSWITRVAVTPDGKHAVSVSNDQSLRVWDIDTGDCLRTLHGHTDQVLDVTVAPDGRLVLSASEDGTVRVWALATGECLAVYYAGAEVRSVSALWPDGRFACGTVDRQLHRLRLRNIP